MAAMGVVPALRVLPGVTSPAASARRLEAFAAGEAHGELRGGDVDQGRVARSSPVSYDEERLRSAAEALTSVPA